METSSQKISIREKICYGLGDSSANIFLGMTMMFIMDPRIQTSTENFKST